MKPKTHFALFSTLAAISFVFMVNLIQQVFARPTLTDTGLLLLFTLIFSGSLAMAKNCVDTGDGENE